MPFVKIWLHVVFSTKDREKYLTDNVRNKVINHILENAKLKGIFIDTIGGYKEHLHCLISLGTEQNVAKIINLIKGESSYWMNKNKITQKKFEWVDEYFAASVSESQINTIRNYIKKQEDHHRKKNYSEEYEEFMTKYGFKYLS